MKDNAGTKITYTGFRVEDPEKYDYGNICSISRSSYVSKNEQVFSTEFR